MLQWKGSVPRKDYPQMLVIENGETMGTIGGGSTEHAVVEKAKTVIQTDCATLENFNLTNLDSESKGSICGGTSQILIEPFTQDIQHFWKSLHYLEIQNDDMIIVTKVQKGESISTSRYLIYPDTPTDLFPENIVKAIKKVQSKRKSVNIETANELFLIQHILSPHILHIFGGGHVAKAVADLAYFIDLDVHVYDDRKNLANSIRFPNVKEINNNTFSTLVGQVQISPCDFAIIVTKSHSHDLELLRWLLSINVSYLGLMSSDRKWKILSQTLIKEGFGLDQIQTVHAPVGIDIQSETVPEIAVSIISEIIKHHRRL